MNKVNFKSSTLFVLVIPKFVSNQIVFASNNNTSDTTKGV